MLLVNFVGKNSGLLFTLVGPGGVGKNALMNAMLARIENLRQLPTATNRPMRAGEVQGVHHLFVDLAEFQRMIADDELLEHQEVHPGRFYGIPQATVETAFENGEDLIADIEIAGAEVLRTHYPDNAVLIFIQPPSLEALEARMIARGETPDEIEKRMQRAPTELTYAEKCKYIVVNDDFYTAVEALYTVITREKQRRDTLQPTQG